jgi:Asp-tRNA(Asn)/Glu-tRNA(Gln) amidotransferase A subunit family amidase
MSIQRFPTDWPNQSAQAIAAQVREGLAKSETIATALLERIKERDSIHAWAHIDRDRVLTMARAIDAADKTHLPLAGVPVGIKDLMDTFDQPTAYGSRLYGSNQPAADAAIVARLRELGALVMGKTVTTEFACRHAGPTVNPHNFAHTPGGSSSGSAAAVADFQIPVGTGTQTAGSVIRPAAFCGLVGFKPTYGEFSRAGIKPCAESLDTVGLLARSVEDIAFMRSALIPAPTPEAPAAHPAKQPRIGLVRTDSWSRAEPAARACLEASAQQLQRAGANVTDVDVSSWNELLEVHRVIMHYELARSFADEALRHPESLSVELRDQIATGRGLTLNAYHEAQAHAEAARIAVDATLAKYDFLLTLSTPGEAPKDLSFTGDPLFNSAWTLLYLPCITLPAGRGPQQLPLGVQLVGPRRQDERLLTWAAWSQSTLHS